MIKQFFDLWGLKYDEASDGQQAVDLARKNKYDIIYIDVHMPVMDGYEATRKIRRFKKYKNTPIIALTADITNGIQKEVNSGLFTDKEIKPIDPDKFYKNMVDIISETRIKNETLSDS